jgi:hypothetical protein
VKLKENIFHKKFPGPETLRDLIKFKMNRSTLRNQNLKFNDENLNYLPNKQFFNNNQTAKMKQFSVKANLRDQMYEFKEQTSQKKEDGIFRHIKIHQ